MLVHRKLDVEVKQSKETTKHTRIYTHSAFTYGKNRLHSLILHEPPSKQNWYHFGKTAAIFIFLHLNSIVVSFHLLQIPSVYTLYIIPLGLGIMEEKQKWIQQYNIYEFCYDFTVHLSVYELNNNCMDLIHFITIWIWKWYL